MADTPNDRLRRARERAGFKTRAEFARKIEIGESTYRHHENGIRNFDRATAVRYARALGKPTTWLWLMCLPENAEAPMASVTGYVGAGEAVIPFDDENAWDPIPAPPGLNDALAAIVRGTSMLPVYRDGDALFFEARRRVQDDAVGRDCLVQIVDGPRQIKRVLKGTKRGWFKLFSYASLSESEDTRLEWASPVSWVMRA